MDMLKVRLTSLSALVSYLYSVPYLSTNYPLLYLCPDGFVAFFTLFTSCFHVFFNLTELKIKPTLTADRNVIPAGGNVTLNCSVKDPADFHYNLRRRSSSGYQTIKVNIDGVFSVSEGGEYTCTGVRRGTNSVTSMSDAIIIYQIGEFINFIWNKTSWNLRTGENPF